MVGDGKLMESEIDMKCVSEREREREKDWKVHVTEGEELIEWGRWFDSKVYLALIFGGIFLIFQKFISGKSPIMETLYHQTNSILKEIEENFKRLPPFNALSADSSLTENDIQTQIAQVHA